MKISMLAKRPVDLAGYRYSRQHYLQTRCRINYLVERYLSIDILSARLADLPTQFENPHQRPWEPIDWQAITPEQIIGVDPALFISVIAGAAEIETPIRAYARESWGYLQSAHPPMARFMGGIFTTDGSPLEVGLWEKEERQHGPAFRKIYQQLTGEKLQPKPNSVEGYQASENLREDVYKHAISRMTTEWGATSVYLWLMAHSTGALQQAIAQPMQDEVNHLAKMWGISYWAFGDSYITRLRGTSKNLISLFKHHQGERTHSNDMLQLTYALHAVELTFTFVRVMVQLHRWNQTLLPGDLEQLFGQPQRDIRD
ncbi:MAG: hypothetical protein KME08_03685 [Aphanothece sp. CMT-3BRIN-NPC111]|jgi:hypothetical protein|nr:hypothetical protein [Aphanothece sp. CMT-3BRIN-NPC111]